MSKWNDSLFSSFQSARSPLRVKADEARLQDAFNAEALQNDDVQKPLIWFYEAGGRFYIDHDCEGVGGYYVTGTGVVAISSHMLCLSPAYFANTLVHEIRHAYQDHQGLLVLNSSNFAEYYIKRALLEADANMHGILAAAKTRGQVITDEKAFMQKHFKAWYSDWDNVGYGRRASHLHAEKLGVDIKYPANNILQSDDMLHGPEMVSHGLDINGYQDVTKLGKSFNGIHYLSGARMHDFLLKTALSPGRAMTFFNTMRQKPEEQENSIRKEMLIRKRKLGNEFFI